MSGRHRLEKSVRGLNQVKLDEITEVPADLGVKINGAETVDVPNREGYVYVRIRGNLSELTKAYNAKVSPVYGLPVIIYRDKVNKGRWVVKGRDEGRYDNWGLSAYLPLHADMHEFNPDSPGADIVWVYGQQFMPLLAVPSGSNGGMSVVIYPTTFYNNGEWLYTGITGTASLAGNKPTDNTARMVLISIDENGNPELTAGSTFPASITGVAEVYQYVPDLPAGSLASVAAVRLVSGTSFITWDNIYDVRQFFGGGTSTGSSGVDTDEKVKVSANDTTAGYLNGKLIQGAGISLTENNNGGNETLSISFTGTTSGGGASDLLIYDDSIFKVTGTAISFDDNINVAVTGSVAFVSAESGIPGPPGDNTLLLYDDNVFKVTGTAIHFNDGLNVFSSGSAVWVDWTGTVGGAYISISGTTYPPTEAELISAFGTPDTFADNKRIGVLNSYNSGTNAYVIFSDGGHYWMLPLAKALETSLSVSVASTATLATQAGRWFGRASVKRRNDGVLVLSYYEAEKHYTNDGELHIRFSDDNGATWSAEDTYLDASSIIGFPMNPPDRGAGEDAGEPWLYLAPNGDLLLHMWRVDYGVTANGTYQSRSTDGGKTWSTGTAINFVGIADDAKVFSTDDDFVFNDVIYAGVRIYDDAIPTNSKNAIIKSVDNGITWEYISDISDYTNDTWEVGIEYIGNNTIISMLRAATMTVSYKRISTDMGLTWGSLIDVTSTVGIAARQRVYTRSHLKGYDSWWNDSILLMVGFVHQTPGVSTSRRSAIWISQDRGLTWSAPQYIDITSEDAGYGDMFYDFDNNRWTVINYFGTQDNADLKQYNLNITGI